MIFLEEEMLSNTYLCLNECIMFFTQDATTSNPLFASIHSMETRENLFVILSRHEHDIP